MILTSKVTLHLIHKISGLLCNEVLSISDIRWMEIISGNKMYVQTVNVSNVKKDVIVTVIGTKATFSLRLDQFSSFKL